MSKWFLIKMKTTPEDGSYIKPHLVSEDICQNVIASLENRFNCKFEYSEAMSGYVLDLPGMIQTNREYYKVDLKDYLVKIPAIDFEYYYNKLLNAKERNEIGTDYYKLHGYMLCVCLTLNERDFALHEMEECLAEAKAVAQIEENDWALTAGKLNKHPNISIPLRNKNKIPEA